MSFITASFTKKKALSIVGIIFAVILAVILLLSFLHGRDDLSTTDGREKFLLKLGWEIDRSTEEYRTVSVPKVLEGVMEEYNKMQLSQGYDLSDHLGETCQQYTYEITNYPNDSRTVLVTLYVQGKNIIAGDIHTSAIDGFMHAIKRNEAR